MVMESLKDEKITCIFQHVKAKHRGRLSRCSKESSGLMTDLGIAERAEESIVYYERKQDLEACLEKRKKKKVIACTSRQLKVPYKDCKTNVGGLNMRQSRWMKLFSECGFEVKYQLESNEVLIMRIGKKSEARLVLD
ncbi:hypothetical protein Tco_0599455 [Tanacetum coccineum]